MEKREFTFYDLLEVLKKYWWVIVLSAIVVATAFGVYAVRSYHEEYTTKTVFYIVRAENMEDPSGTSTSMAQEIQTMSWAQKVMNSYIEILTLDSFAEKVNDDLHTNFPELSEQYGGNKGMIKGAITLAAHEDSNLFDLTVRTGSIDCTYEIARSIEKLAPIQIADITNNKDSIIVVDDADKPTVPSNSNRLVRNAVIGFLIGALIAYVIFFVIELLDVRIKNEEDLVSNYEVPLLGTIPDYSSEIKSTRSGY